MKTFQEFLEQIYIIEGRSREEILTSMSAGVDKRRRMKRKRPIELLAAIKGVRGGRNTRGPEMLRKASDISKIYASPSKRAQELRKKTIRDLRTHYDEKDYQKAKKKEIKLIRSGMHTHHITPLHYSRELKSRMTPKEWKERVRKDAESGIYHGHHHKNLMGVVVAGTPESRSRRGIYHQKGGAHELESKTKDLYSTGISHKSLISAAHRIKLKKERNKKP